MDYKVAKNKAEQYAKKVGYTDDKSILIFLSGFQACAHQSGKAKTQEIRENFRQNGKELPPQLERALVEVETLLEKFE